MKNEKYLSNIIRLMRFNEKEINYLKSKGGADYINCAVISSGCKLNRFESSQLEVLFKRLNNLDININMMEGLPSAVKNSGLDENIGLFLVNTCTVTEKAETETNRIIRKIRRKYPDGMIILTGCSAQLNKNKFSEMNNIKLIDNVQKTELLKISAEKFPDAILRQKRTRPYLKIQEGCELNCAYCIIPKARPVKWSMDAKNILDIIKKLGESGYKEVILTGVNLGSYTDKNSKTKLKNLLAGIEELKSNVRIRLSSIDPVYIDDETVKIFASSKKIRNHFHIPLQSASDKILKSMNRNYNFRDYALTIEKISEAVKDVSIGTDIISGFPGETYEDFAETEDRLKILPLHYIHAFSYSDRPGTKSYAFKQKIGETEIKRRTNIIRNISEQKKIEFHKKFQNKTLEFLALNDNKAISSNYIKAKIIADSIVEAGTPFTGKIKEIPETFSDGSQNKAPTGNAEIGVEIDALIV